MTLRSICSAKIHRATVTDANIDYIGSILLPPDLMDMVDIVEGQQVAVWDITNGARLETYAIRGAAGSRDVIINGAGAHLIHKGDKVIVAAFVLTDEAIKPKYILVNDDNAFDAWLVGGGPLGLESPESPKE
jgi:aspartate 1-decarboxylase